METWFLIVGHEPTSGSYNMAVDDFLLRIVEKNKGKTFLRFYQWKKPTISIGRRQRVSRALNLEKLKKFSADFVRRPTGGKAVLHWEEITYSIASSSKKLNLIPSIRHSYNLIAKALLEGLRILGIDADIVSKNPKGLTRTDLPCFSYPTRDEITIKGKKIIGSAQKRLKDSFLQHGSIPVVDHSKMYAEITNVEHSILKESMTTIANELKRVPEFEELYKAFKTGFEKVFEIDFYLYEFSNNEINEITQIENEIYKQKKWNFELE